MITSKAEESWAEESCSECEQQASIRVTMTRLSLEAQNEEVADIDVTSQSSSAVPGRLHSADCRARKFIAARMLRCLLRFHLDIRCVMLQLRDCLDCMVYVQ